MIISYMWRVCSDGSLVVFDSSTKWALFQWHHTPAGTEMQNQKKKKRKLLLPKSASVSHESVQAVSPESPSHPWDHGILGGADVTGVYVCMCWCQQGGRSSAPLCPFPMGIGGQLGYLKALWITGLWSANTHRVSQLALCWAVIPLFWLSFMPSHAHVV